MASRKNLNILVFINTKLLVKDILGLKEADPKTFEHVRQSRTLANKFIINKLIEQTRKLSANMTKSKSARRSCEMETENFG